MHLEEIALAFVYLATDEAADINSMVLAKDIKFQRCTEL
jgi:hypothetical protein